MSYVPSVQADMIELEKRRLWSVQGYGADEMTAKGLYDMVKGPAVRATFMGLTSWGVARLAKAQPKVAMKIGLITGGIELLVSLGSNWLKKELEKTQQV